MQWLGTRNYYDILGLKEDCTQKEIRNAFVTLSKECHPDVNVSQGHSSAKKADQDFIQLMEAYQVLSKTHSRANYDLSLKGIDTVNYIRRNTMYEPWKVDPSSYSEKGPNYSPYYGVQGMKKLSNRKIVAACIMFCAFGILLQVLAITRSVTFKRDQLDKSSAIYITHHEQAKSAAESLGKVENLERVILRMKSSGLDKDLD